MVGFSAVSEISILGRVLVPIEGRRWLILFLIVRILSLKKVIKILLFRDRGILVCGGVTLCQPGYSAEEKPGVVFIFLY